MRWLRKKMRVERWMLPAAVLAAGIAFDLFDLGWKIPGWHKLREWAGKGIM